MYFTTELQNDTKWNLPVNPVKLIVCVFEDTYPAYIVVIPW